MTGYYCRERNERERHEPPADVVYLGLYRVRVSPFPQWSEGKSVNCSRFGHVLRNIWIPLCLLFTTEYSHPIAIIFDLFFIFIYFFTTIWPQWTRDPSPEDKSVKILSQADPIFTSYRPFVELLLIFSFLPAPFLLQVSSFLPRGCLYRESSLCGLPLDGCAYRVRCRSNVSHRQTIDDGTITSSSPCWTVDAARYDLVQTRRAAARCLGSSSTGGFCMMNPCIGRVLFSLS